jgi:hypothetical protein
LESTTPVVVRGAGEFNWQALTIKHMILEIVPTGICLDCQLIVAQPLRKFETSMIKSPPGGEQHAEEIFDQLGE